MNANSFDRRCFFFCTATLYAVLVAGCQTANGPSTESTAGAPAKAVNIPDPRLLVRNEMGDEFCLIRSPPGAPQSFLPVIGIREVRPQDWNVMAVGGLVLTKIKDQTHCGSEVSISDGDVLRIDSRPDGKQFDVRIERQGGGPLKLSRVFQRPAGNSDAYLVATKDDCQSNCDTYDRTDAYLYIVDVPAENGDKRKKLVFIDFFPESTTPSPPQNQCDAERPDNAMDPRDPAIPCALPDWIPDLFDRGKIVPANGLQTGTGGGYEPPR